MYVSIIKRIINFDKINKMYPFTQIHIELNLIASCVSRKVALETVFDNSKES